jgi:undecaprenyl diphosphate synthase
MNPIKHVAIIMDGNGRWGTKYKKSRNAGHRAGLNTVEKIIKETIKAKIKYLTLYTFSTENWKRPKSEIIFLFELLENFLIKKIKDLIKSGIRLKILGDKKLFSKKLKKLLKDSERKTLKNKKLQINLALNYGSKNEIINAVRLVNKKNIEITKKNIEDHLYTKNIPDPEILIRTGNTNRLSNFLLWQLAYTEIFFEKKLWPDFNSDDFKKILVKFKKLKRNFGNI